MKEINPHMLVLLGVLGALSIAVFIVFFTRVVDRGGLKEESGPEPEPDGKSIVIAGKSYGLHTVAVTAGSPHWVLSVPVAAPHTFSVQREDGLEKLIDHLGVMAKVSSGDAHFDDEFEIRSHDAAWTGKFFSDPENRRLVQELFGLDSSTVLLSGGRLQACFEEKASLADGGPALAELAARVPAAV